MNYFEEIKVNGVNLHNTRYPDDTVLISKPQRQLQKMLNEPKKIGEQYEMPININKTECFVVIKLGTAPRVTLSLKETQLNRHNIVDILVYLFLVTEGALMKQTKELHWPNKHS